MLSVACPNEQDPVLTRVWFGLVSQNATDSSSNSSHSQKKEPLQLQTLAPPSFCEPRRHHCILGHFYDQHRHSDHYFLDQVGGWGTTVAKVGHQNFDLEFFF